MELLLELRKEPPQAWRDYNISRLGEYPINQLTLLLFVWSSPMDKAAYLACISVLWLIIIAMIGALASVPLIALILVDQTSCTSSYMHNNSEGSILTVLLKKKIIRSSLNSCQV